mmetsp:Transcript_52287/g.106569  ORF Transcript_52287/g.106569 Transcript_52287/m.106569 type:complete len:215 (-) Transcript_52287:159-803(-)
MAGRAHDVAPTLEAAVKALFTVRLMRGTTALKVDSCIGQSVHIGPTACTTYCTPRCNSPPAAHCTPACSVGIAVSMCSPPSSSHHRFGAPVTTSGLHALRSAPDTPPSMGVKLNLLAALMITSTRAIVMSPSTTATVMAPMTTERRTFAGVGFFAPTAFSERCVLTLLKGAADAGAGMGSFAGAGSFASTAFPGASAGAFAGAGTSATTSFPVG